eukprot:CAMPEP_0203675038 /NCGR_PEP_ID=MMETSP0090-20130426/18463_1 /ASSEMBLY_ACC=CAM_ASM_001088 /TAXON_ID=426623 /ORGANISM="Chaetoceros affinis, Strain CCMP159" /LENGTH=471 /DNA_ID=CAMNT_0050541087 /DNA_START=309 /DNA_END=1724 /DNA_ORIENTATION=+
MYGGKYSYIRGTKVDYNRKTKDGVCLVVPAANIGYVEPSDVDDDGNENFIDGSEDTKYCYNNEYVGRDVAKIFHGVTIDGKVEKLNKQTALYNVLYIDGDDEYMSQEDLEKYMEVYEEVKRKRAMDAHISTRTYNNNKSLLRPSVTFLDYLGKCREDQYVFRWLTDRFSEIDLNRILHIDRNLGRVYFDKFVLQNRTFEVGDFIRETVEHDDQLNFYRILGAFQALKSFVGKWPRAGNNWSSDTENIQQRGFVYLQLAQLVPGSSEIELCLLKDAHQQYKSVAIDRLPLHVGQLGKVKKIEVKVNENCGGRQNEYLCNSYRKSSRQSADPLENDDHLLLGGSGERLLDELIPHHWDVRFDAQAALFIQKRDGVERILSKNIRENFLLINECVSDDSDEFDEESRNLLDSMSLAPKRKRPEIFKAKRPRQFGPCDDSKQACTKKKKLRANSTPATRKRKKLSCAKTQLRRKR